MYTELEESLGREFTEAVLKLLESIDRENRMLRPQIRSNAMSGKREGERQLI